MSLRAQVDSTASPTVIPIHRQDAWASAGIGVGLGGLAMMASGWYSDNNLVFGAHAAKVAELWGSLEAHDVALMVGVRNLSPHSLIMVALGPAGLGGTMYVGDPYIPRTVATNEIGMALSAEAIINFSEVGIGLDAFAARSSNRLVQGVTLSFQVGWLGN